MGKLNINTSKAVAEVRKLLNELTLLKNESKKVGNATVKNFKRIDNSIIQLTNHVNLISSKLASIDVALKKNTAELDKNRKAVTKLKKRVKELEKAEKGATKATKAQTTANKVLLTTVKALAGGFGLLALGTIIKDITTNVFNNVKTFDSLGFTLEKITKTSFDYENSQRFLLRITQAYGVELIATTTRWTRFLAAAQESGLSLRDTEKIFESMTKSAGVLGLRTDELTSVYLALEQMLSKGKITTEELRRQLGERLPGAMGIMAASIGVTIPVLDKMLKKGEVLSAEVLPDFADAVERAYGVENVDRIETLVAKQNRLTTAWQTFIKNLSEGDSVIKKVFGGFIDLLQEAITFYDVLFSTDKQKRRIEIGIEEKRFADGLKRSSHQFLEFQRSVEEQDIKLNIDEKALKKALLTATGSEEIKTIKEGLDEIARLRAIKGKENEVRQKEIAKAGLEEAYNDYVVALAKFEDEDEKYNAAKWDLDKAYSGNKRKQLSDDLVYATAKYNVFRKLVEESNVSVLPDSSSDKQQRRLREIKDYTLETINDIAQATKKANDDRAADEDLNLKERLAAIKKAADIEIFIATNKNKIALRDYERKQTQEIKSINASVEGERLARSEADKFIRKLEDEKAEYILLKNTQLSTDLIAIRDKAIKDSGGLQLDVTNDINLSSIKDSYNQRIIAAKQEFQASKKTNQDRQKLDRALAESAWEMANDIIDANIRVKEAKIDILQSVQDAAGTDQNSEAIARLRKEINELEASKKVEPPIDEKEWADVFDTVMDLAAEFTSAIADLTDAIYDRKIENINAEIQAETDKYDRLIALAEGDEEQQKTLERNKENRIKRLERERLKQEQKQAKARKKFAIADIAISTAQAIMQIWAHSPDFTGISQGVLTAIIAAIGAAQIAAVVAAPIPQYKEGVSNLSKDQVAMINDGSYKEYIERNGQILSTDKKNAVVGLQKGDTVYKNYDEMTRRSSLFKLKNIQAQQRYHSDKLLQDVTGAVTKGFSKAKINNKLSINNVIKDNNYKESLSMWN